MSAPVTQLLGVIYGYLQLGVGGRLFVKRMDDLIADNPDLRISDEFARDLDRLHVKLALCVWDDQTFSEAPMSYIREPEMRAEVKSFIEKWGPGIADVI